MMHIVHRYLEEAFAEWKEKTLWFVGSFPSVLVREAFGRINKEKDVNYFYGSAQNRFWPTLFSLSRECNIVHVKNLSFGWDNANAVKERKGILHALDIGITDIYAKIESGGKASDNDIVPLEWNPYLEKILTHAKVIFTTSRFVTKILISQWRKKILSFPTIVTLPSPSSLSRKGGYTDEKLRQTYFQLIFPYLGEKIPLSKKTC